VPRPPAVFRPAWQIAAAALLAAVVVLSSVLAASPSVRQAVERWFGLGGVRISATPRPPTLPPERPIGHGLNLGQRTTLVEAERHLGHTIPQPGGLGPPDAVYVHDLSIGGAEAFLVYRARPGLPAAHETGVGLLLSAFTGDIYRPGLQKFSFGATIERVSVTGSRGFWIEGGHGVTYLDANGQEVGEETRLAGNVLLWERGALTLRLESALSKSEALRIAASTR